MNFRERIHQFGDQEVTDENRRLVVVIVVGSLIAVVVALLLLRGGEDPDAAPAPRAAPVTQAPLADVAPEPPEAAPVSVKDTVKTIRGAKRAVRRFLVGYLPFTYGQGSATAIRGATAQLRAALTANPPRSLAGNRRARARVLLLQTEDATDRGVSVLATIEDGVRTYSVRVDAERRGSRWAITAIR